MANVGVVYNNFVARGVRQCHDGLATAATVTRWCLMIKKSVGGVTGVLLNFLYGLGRLFTAIARFRRQHAGAIPITRFLLDLFGRLYQ